MLDVFSDWVFGALNSNEVLVLAFATLQRQPVESFISFIFITLYEIPAKREVLSYVIDRRAFI